MKAKELIEAVAEATGKPKTEVKAFADALVTAISGDLKGGNETDFFGLGKFSVTHKPESKGRNVATGEPITVAARNVPKFKPGKALKDAVN